MEQAKENWGEAELLTGKNMTQEEALAKMKAMVEGGLATGIRRRKRDTKKQVDLRKRKAKRKKARKSRKAA